MPARGARALERGATALGATVARSLYGRWRRMPSARREQLERIAGDVRERTLGAHGEPAQPDAGAEPPAPTAPAVDAVVEPTRIAPEVSDIEVRDLRDDLARELDRVARGEVRASRGSGDAARSDTGR